MVIQCDGFRARESGELVKNFDTVLVKLRMFVLGVLHHIEKFGSTTTRSTVIRNILSH